ncbi:SRPBCC domain-containing protein [Gemmatimonas sp.]|uniref:SRPBCC family protein n=1 Tax=Gemmatimonas sp. TaxID=1962908 RepID=UPI003569CF5C
MAGKKSVARRHVGKDAPKVAPRKNAAAAEKKFGKAARQAAEKGGKKPGAWRDAEQPRVSLAAAPTPPEALGTVAVTVSRTIDASPSEVFRAFNDPKRRQWSGTLGYRVVSAVAPRFLRLMMHDGTLVSVSMGRKGNARCAVDLEHSRLPNASEGERMKAEWKDGMAKMAEQLDGF